MKAHFDAAELKMKHRRNSLDALCDRYGVSNAHRKLHGALLDSELLADVYLAMTRGQNSLSMEEEVEVAADGAALEIVPLAEVIFQSATADELAISHDHRAERSAAFFPHPSHA